MVATKLTAIIVFSFLLFLLLINSSNNTQTKENWSIVGPINQTCLTYMIFTKAIKGRIQLQPYWVHQLVAKGDH
ncbi:hypothetical protein GOBAR_DD13872 [Gossypium barbadense]|nr:hypothetical protein GOBAR_DD13872 [Gossypium barbadense]